MCVEGQNHLIWHLALTLWYRLYLSPQHIRSTMVDNGGDEVQRLRAKPIPTRVDHINFEGLDRTKHDILHELVKPLLRTSDLGEVVHSIKEVRQRFRELGLFRNVQVSIDEATKSSGGGDEGVTNLAINFDVEETRRYAGGIYVSGSTNEASLTLELRSPNLLGRGEELRGQFEHSLKYYSSWSASLSKPLLRTLWPSLNSSIDVSILQASRDAPWSDFKQLDRNLICDLNIQPSLNHLHFVRWETSWRNLSFLSFQPELEILQQFGHSLKSSISHTYAYDRRDNPMWPSSGWVVKLFNEYAGFHKDGVSFHKHEAEFQHNLALSARRLTSLQTTFKCGTMRSISNVTVADKFFLGGPLNLRGFHLNAVGPHGETGRSALGALSYWVGAVHLYHPLPFKNAFNEYLRVHAFVNAGNIDDNPRQLLKNIRLSYGAGLSLSFGSKVRLEINYCLPVLSEKMDKVQRGLQFGIGVNFT